MNEKTAAANRRRKRGGGKRPKGSRAKVERLAPGELDKLVLGYMRRHKKDAPHTPGAVAKGVKRSSGAVANCLDRLAAVEKVRLTTKKPRRYELTENAK